MQGDFCSYEPELFSVPATSLFASSYIIQLVMSAGKPTAIVNYDHSLYPLVHFIESEYKNSYSQLKFHLQSLQMLTCKYSHLFVKHFCILYEEIERKDKMESQISVIRETGLLSFPQLTEAAKNKEQIAQKAQILKKAALDVLRQAGLDVKQDDMVCCIVERNKKYELKANFKSYHIGVWQEEVKEGSGKELTPEILTIQDEGVIQKFKEAYENTEIDALEASYKLLRVQKAYFSKVFQETDHLVKYKHFSGEEKWLQKFGSTISFQEKIDGVMYPIVPYYSCVQCTSHFKGYGPKGKEQLEQDKKSNKVRRCDVCKQQIIDIAQDKILNKIMTCVYNPKRMPILYFPLCNRFKILDKQKNQFVYENYYHFRDTMQELGKFLRAPIIPQNKEQFDMTFMLGNKKTIIEDPCRGLHCRHLGFCDLRELYATKKEFMYKCPVCKANIQQTQIVYLRQVLILLKFANSTLKKGKATLTGPQTYFKLEIIHGDKEKDQIVRIKYKLNSREPQSYNVSRIYKTLLDPHYPFDETELDLSDEELENQVRQYYWLKEVSLD